ncbi:T3SS effector HopA1 family protein [Kitasatospora sp. NPDC059827]|uniref:T3SS effector HopA1 family protein n=1 Tax=Kitasatospora sp. NPDC059827 TaxID=3346964 RepID=UPI0036577DED
MTTSPKSAGLPGRLLAALEGVEVATDLCEAEVGGRSLRADSPRDLRRLLSGALYEVLHAGQDVAAGAMPFRIRDEAFERTLTEAVPHRRTVVSARLCVAPGPPTADPRLRAEAGMLLVEREGVRVWMPRESVRNAEAAVAGDRVTLVVPPTRPALSPGFFLVDGSMGHRRPAQLLRVYVNLTHPRHAAAVWHQVLSHLEDNRVPYRSKVLSTPALYARRDALVVYLGVGFEAEAAGVAKAVDGMTGVGAETSAFTDRLARGVATAWEPDDPRPEMQGLSFGQHRAAAVALALMDRARDGSPIDRALVRRFLEANIDPGAPARNLTRP